MTTTETSSHTAVPRAQNRECVACGRPYGRRRAPRAEADSAQTTLLDSPELVVCDQCWHLAGNTTGVTARLASNPSAPALMFDPEVEALLLAANEYDLLHPLDRLIVESGVRWPVLRHIAVPARMQLAAWIAQRCPPEATRPADSPDVWLDAVEARIRAQTRPDQSCAGARTAAPSSPTGDQFVYNAKRRRWWRICRILRCCADRDARPLTWVTQEEIAAAIGCSTRTVRRCVAWLRDERLLWEIVPGCRLPQQSAPDNETNAEAAQRARRMTAAIAAEEAAMARARAELSAVRDGQRGPDAVTVVDDALHLIPATPYSGHDGTDSEPEAEPTLVNLAPVYELRVPLPAPGEPLQRPAAASSNVLNSANTTASSQDVEIVRPPQVSNQDYSSSKSVQPVDNRRAPRSINKRPQSEPDGQGSDVGSPGNDSLIPAATRAEPTESDQAVTRQSEAVRAAQWLLRSRLDPRICDRVPVRWLAAQIRGAHLLDRHNWTWDDLADQLHGYPEHTHLPYHIRDCRAWIRARISRAIPTLSPAKLRIVLDIERGSDLLRQRRRAALEAERQADIASRRAGITNCGLCDEVGWIHVDSSTPTARCNHDPDSGGW